MYCFAETARYRIPFTGVMPTTHIPMPVSCLHYEKLSFAVNYPIHCYLDNVDLLMQLHVDHIFGSSCIGALSISIGLPYQTDY